MHIDLEPVTKDNWRAVAALRVKPEQGEFVSDTSHYLLLCHYGELWHPLAVTVAGQVAGFCMWAVDDDKSRWIGGVVVDAGRQRQGIGRAMIVALRDRLVSHPGTPNVALSYLPENVGARALYQELGFVETGEREDEEIIARWMPGA